jgi:hypothetical protein
VRWRLSPVDDLELQLSRGCSIGRGAVELDWLDRRCTAVEKRAIVGISMNSRLTAGYEAVVQRRLSSLLQALRTAGGWLCLRS